jgi:tetratricopeptide (TPR) repeat protein
VIIPGLYKLHGYTGIHWLFSERFEVVAGTTDSKRPANYFEFAYDWRRCNAASARKLQRFVDERLHTWREHIGSGTANFAAARGAYEEARDIYAKLAGADPQTYESDLAMTLNNLGILYRYTRDFAAARGAYEEARDNAT